MRILLGVVVALLSVPASASAQRVEDSFFNSVFPIRVDHLIGFTPTTFAIHPRDQQVVPIKVRVGGRTHRYVFSNAEGILAWQHEPELPNAHSLRLHAQKHVEQNGIRRDLFTLDVEVVLGKGNAIVPVCIEVLCLFSEVPEHALIQIGAATRHPL
jgi:hypothetical protein